MLDITRWILPHVPADSRCIKTIILIINNRNCQYLKNMFLSRDWRKSVHLENLLRYWKTREQSYFGKRKVKGKTCRTMKSGVLSPMQVPWRDELRWWCISPPLSLSRDAFIAPTQPLKEFGTHSTAGTLAARGFRSSYCVLFWLQT